MPGHIVSAVPPLTPPTLFRPYQLLVELPTSAVPFNTNPPCTVRLAPLTALPTSNTPLTVTPLNVPLLTTNDAPLVVRTLPPRTLPPLSTHEPELAPSNTSVVLVLFNVPVRFTVPPLRVNAPRLASVNAPPRFTVAFVTLMAPALAQLPFKVSVDPLSASAWLFTQLPLSVSVPLPLADNPTTLAR